MTAGLSLLGLVIAALVCGGAVLLVLWRWQDAIERDDEIARAASGMDEFSAPEGGEPR